MPKSHCNISSGRMMVSLVLYCILGPKAQHHCNFPIETGLAATYRVPPKVSTGLRQLFWVRLVALKTFHV